MTKKILIFCVVFVLVGAGVAVAGNVSLQQAMGLINQQSDLEGQSKVFHNLPADTQKQIEDNYRIDPASGKEETLEDESGPVKKGKPLTSVGMLPQPTTVANVTNSEKARGLALMNDVLAKANQAAKAAAKGKEQEARSNAEVRAFKALSKADQEQLKKASTISSDYREETWYYDSDDSTTPSKIVVEQDTLNPEAMGVAYHKSITADAIPVAYYSESFRRVLKVHYKYTMLGFKALGDFRLYYWKYIPYSRITWVAGNWSWGEAYAPFIKYDGSATVISKSGGVGYSSYTTTLRRHWWQGFGATDGWGSITWANAYIWHTGTQTYTGGLTYSTGG